MSGEINVLQRTQLIIVEPVYGTVSIINAGPPGPPGPSNPFEVVDLTETTLISQGAADIETGGEASIQFVNAGFMYVDSPVYHVTVKSGTITISEITDAETADINVDLWSLIELADSCPFSAINFYTFVLPSFLSSCNITEGSVVKIISSNQIMNLDGTALDAPLELFDKISIEFSSLIYGTP
jgi:hypothetical protein